ncbi:MAG TPA: MarR family transcriptional regulator [Chryseosolibacter sp.]|nr:MarR family transcriptional regulator [Chryseosolibacter sp.]
MSIETAILQEKFQSEHEKAVVNILYTSSWLHHVNASRLKPFAITPEQFNVLRILRGSHPKPMMLNDIACRMIDKSSNATRLVEKLRQKTMVDRKQCENNRRQVDISITQKGLLILKEIDQLESEFIQTLKNLSKDEAAQLNSLLDKLRG